MRMESTTVLREVADSALVRALVSVAEVAKYRSRRIRFEVDLVGDGK